MAKSLILANGNIFVGLDSHGFVNDFKEWEFSSYHTILKNNNGLLASQKVLDWFGGGAAFEKTHKDKYAKRGLEKFIIE